MVSNIVMSASMIIVPPMAFVIVMLGIAMPIIIAIGIVKTIGVVPSILSVALLVVTHHLLSVRKQLAEYESVFDEMREYISKLEKMQ